MPVRVTCEAEPWHGGLRTGSQRLSAQAQLQPSAHLALAQPSANEVLERIEFALGDRRYHIAMPKGSKLHDLHRPGCIEIRHPHSIRLMKFLELCSAAGPTAAAYKSQTPRSTTAPASATTWTTTSAAAWEGPRGPQLELEGRVLGLTCRDQSEWKTSPGWCLHYLRSLEIEDRKQ